MSRLLCTTCGHIGLPDHPNKGSGLIELVLWLTFLVPGIFYSMWRRTGITPACELCGHTQLIPPESPMARRIVGDVAPRLSPDAAERLPSPVSEPARPPSRAAKSFGYFFGRLVGKMRRRDRPVT